MKWSVRGCPFFVCRLSVLGMSTIIDRIFYEHWVVAPLNFMQFNIMSGGSSFYGTNPWHWYFSQGIPAVLGVNVVPFLLGIRCSNTKIPLLLIIWFTAVLRFVCACVFLWRNHIAFRYIWLSWPFKKWNCFSLIIKPHILLVLLQYRRNTLQSGCCTVIFHY